MKNTKITRTINTATATVLTFNPETEDVAQQNVTMATTQKVTPKEFKKYVESKGYTVLKVGEITYTSKLYEMDLNTFIENAVEVGDGRVTL